MANPQHVQIVKQGQSIFATWRLQHSGENLDLRDAELSGLDLSSLDLTGADLSRADCARANLSGTRLDVAELTGASLDGANLFGASISESGLVGANLRDADLLGASIAICDLSNIDLRGSRLVEATIRRSNLEGADLSQATFGNTTLTEIDISRTMGLDATHHESPSSIDVDTMIRSFRNIRKRDARTLRQFFLGAGVPKELLDALPAILADVEYYSCFISYGQPDLTFAERLSDDLRALGISCWLYALDATPGERTWREIGTRRREAERVIILCSAPALIRDGVLKEVEEQIDEDPDKLVPASLDNLWREPGFKVTRGDRDLKPFLLDRNYADFAGTTYQIALERLVRGVRRQPGKKQ